MAAEARFRLDAAASDPGADPTGAARAAALGVIVGLVGVEFFRAAAWTSWSSAAQRRDGVKQSLEKLTIINIRAAQSEDKGDALVRGQECST